MSDDLKSSDRVRSVAPCVRYISSGKPAAVPAPASTATSSPAFRRPGTAAGTTATRVSPGQVSLGMPTLIGQSVVDSHFFSQSTIALATAGVIVFSGSESVLRHFSGSGGRQQMVDARKMQNLDGRRLLARARQLRKPVGVMRKDLPIEVPLDDQDRLLDFRHDLRRIEQQQAAEPRGCRPASAAPRGIASQPLSVTTAAWIRFCSSIFDWRSASGTFIRSRVCRCCSRINSDPGVPGAAIRMSDPIFFRVRRRASRPRHPRCVLPRRCAAGRYPFALPATSPSSIKSSA